MRWCDERTWSKLVLAILVGLVSAFLLSGCKTKYVPMEKISYRDVVRHDTLNRHDSIYVHDSIFASRKGDTLFVDRWHRETVLKKIYRNKIDSFVKRDSIPVPYPVEKQLTEWERFQLKYAVWSMGALCMVLLYVCVKLYKWIKDGKFKHFNIKK